jgi:hypothetical protein
VTLGSSPPIYRARLFGSGAARRRKPAEPLGDKRLPPLPSGDVTPGCIALEALGILIGGGIGGGGRCDAG